MLPNLPTWSYLINIILINFIFQITVHPEPTETQNSPNAPRVRETLSVQRAALQFAMLAQMAPFLMSNSLSVVIYYNNYYSYIIHLLSSL